MPKYGFHVGSTFNPTSVEDYLRPGLAYVQTYKDYEKRYQDMIDATADLKKLAEMEGSEQAYATYDAYQKQLKEAANNLATTGWNRDRDIQSAMDLRRQFAEDIVPIKEAYNTWAKRADEQRAMFAKDNSLIFENDFSNTGVDYFLKNPNATSRMYSTDAIKDSVYKAAGNLAREAREDLVKNGVNSKWYRILGGQYFEKAKTTGLTADDILSASFDPITGEIKNNANPYISRIINNAIDESGMRNWSNWEGIRDRVYSAALNGAFSAIGEVDYRNLQNRDYDTTPGDIPQMITPMPGLNPVNIVVQRERDTADTMVNDYTSGALFDGKGKLKPGIRENILGEQVSPTIINGLPTYSPTTLENNLDNPYFNVLYKVAHDDNPNLTKEEFAEIIQSGGHDDYIQALYKKMVTGNPYNRFNAKELFEYDYPLSEGTTQKNLKNKITGNLYEATFDTKKQQWVSTGKTLSNVDLSSDKYKIVSIHYGRYGNTLMIKGPDGTQEYLMPSNINSVMEDNLVNSTEAAYLYAEALRNNKQLVMNNVTGGFELSDSDLTEKQREEYYRQMVKFQNSAQQSMANVIGTNKVKDVEYEQI